MTQDIRDETVEAQPVQIYPQPTIDVTRADPATAQRLIAYFDAKNSHSADDTMAFFSPQMTAYTDATLGWKIEGYEAEKALFAQYMPHWGAGRSYAIRILGGPDSAIVVKTDTPELFGDELHSWGAVDMRDGKIVRWVDYWDSSAFNDDLFHKMVVPADSYPADLGEAGLDSVAAPRMLQVCGALHQALTDNAAIDALFAYDAVYEDIGLRTVLIGRSAIARYLGRLAGEAPFGAGAQLRHVVGNEAGGGYEWIASPDYGVKAGVTALELDGAGLISRLTTVYDPRPMPIDRRRQLAARSIEP